MEIYKTFFKLLAVCSLVSCAPTYTGQQTQTTTPERKLENLTLISFTPSTLMIDGNLLEIYFSITQIGSVPSYNFRMPSSIKIEDDSVVFALTLTETEIPIPLSYGFVTFPVVFGLSITNKLDEPITVKWDSVSYIDQKGISHRVMKMGTRYAERDRATVDVSIPPNARIEEKMLPTDFVLYESGSYGGWRSTPVLENLDEGNKVSIFIPIVIREKTKNYSFVFQCQNKHIHKEGE